jgi:hypothetical protein
MGRANTKNLARELFGLLAEMYYSKCKPYQKYCGLLNTIRSKVVTAMRELWRYRGRNWFDQMYLKDVNDVLDTAIVHYRNKARAAKLRSEPTSRTLKRGSLKVRKLEPEFPNRAKWLKDRLRERHWNKYRLEKYGGPAHKSTQKVLDAISVTDGVLERISVALAKHSISKKPGAAGWPLSISRWIKPALAFLKNSW